MSKPNTSFHIHALRNGEWSEWDFFSTLEEAMQEVAESSADWGNWFIRLEVSQIILKKEVL